MYGQFRAIIIVIKEIMIELLKEIWYDHALNSVETIFENKVTIRCKLTELSLKTNRTSQVVMKTEEHVC